MQGRKNIFQIVGERPPFLTPSSNPLSPSPFNKGPCHFQWDGKCRKITWRWKMAGYDRNLREVTRNDRLLVWNWWEIDRNWGWIDRKLVKIDRLPTPKTATREQNYITPAKSLNEQCVWYALLKNGTYPHQSSCLCSNRVRWHLCSELT